MSPFTHPPPGCAFACRCSAANVERNVLCVSSTRSRKRHGEGTTFFSPVITLILRQTIRTALLSISEKECIFDGSFKKTQISCLSLLFSALSTPRFVFVLRHITWRIATTQPKQHKMSREHIFCKLAFSAICNFYKGTCQQQLKALGFL